MSLEAVSGLAIVPGLCRFRGVIMGDGTISHVSITTNATSTDGSVVVDGQDLANSVRRLTLTAGVGEFTELTIDVMPRQAAEFNGDAFVRLNADFETFLVGLGWTPPRRHAAQ